MRTVLSNAQQILALFFNGKFFRTYSLLALLLIAFVCSSSIGQEQKTARPLHSGTDTVRLGISTSVSVARPSTFAVSSSTETAVLPMFITRSPVDSNNEQTLLAIGGKLQVRFEPRAIEYRIQA